MNFKYSTTSIALVLMAFSVLSLNSIQQDAFAEFQGMSLTAEAADGSDIIKIHGQTASQVTDITFTVTSPDGFNVLAADQIKPDAQGFFSTEFKIGPSWSQDGFYTIEAMQGVRANPLYTMSVSVEIIDGMTLETLETESNLVTGIFVPAQEEVAKKGLTMKANAMEGSTTIGIIGSSDRTNLDVTLKVIAPNGNVVSVEQITPDLDGKFAKDITTGGPLWTQDGIYTVSAQQGESPDHKASVEVEIVDGVVIPEFGAIAALILAVAIMSIIVVSAKSRLSIMPRY
ncbi:MAG: PEFG-CTERM sorting domain-containing protein [Nitrosopumilus sp.]|jgi:predicted secreted protein with PEFG-CTERM motif|uniref:PEFG-CTERM sorting domain-containing protein n=1 Tax=Candidatus Nitrosomaritimum aestuariumsis TaxID=3342354 RepID=A0AC60W713_9ARCH|nr:PEFG-CTERM sorting domain-containing protein [Nitrosopumilaceae archaeon]